MTYRDRREARAERLRGWAEKRQTDGWNCGQGAEGMKSDIVDLLGFNPSQRYGVRAEALDPGLATAQIPHHLQIIEAQTMVETMTSYSRANTGYENRNPSTPLPPTMEILNQPVDLAGSLDRSDWPQQRSRCLTPAEETWENEGGYVPPERELSPVEWAMIEEFWTLQAEADREPAEYRREVA